MKHLLALAVAALCCAAPALAWGQTAAAPREVTQVDLAELLYRARAVVIFAPAAQDAEFLRQMELLAADRGDLAARDAVVIIDTDPAARSALRQKLRPSGFSLVLIDKDGKTALRKPHPWSLRELTRAIDVLPSRRSEMLQRLPAGR
jgi:hypothetical protein